MKKIYYKLKEIEENITLDIHEPFSQNIRYFKDTADRGTNRELYHDLNFDLQSRTHSAAFHASKIIRKTKKQYTISQECIDLLDW